MGSCEINELARRQILAAAQQALKAADAYGVLPTPLDDLGEAMGVLEVVDISQLPDDLEASGPSGFRKLLGAYLFRAETAFVDFSQPTGRARFIQAHELGHRVVPWHEGAYVDDEQQLFRETEELLELEASLAAAHLIFQGKPFFERALEYPLSVRTPILLAPQFAASLHATIHYYVEHHPDPVAGLIAGRFRRCDGSVPIFRSLESAAWRARFGPIGDRFPNRRLPIDDSSLLGPLLASSRLAVDPPSQRLVVQDLRGAPQRCTAESFFNQRCYFVLFAPHARLRSGRRIKVAS